MIQYTCLAIILYAFLAMILYDYFVMLMYVYQHNDNVSFVWFDSLRLINDLSVKQGLVFLGWTSTKLA